MEIKAIVGAKLGALTVNKSTCTNPFEKNVFKGKSFKGSVLPFADLFETIKPAQTAKPNKLKMIAGAMADATNGFKKRITEPIALFAQKVRENIAHGIESVKNMKNSLVEMHKNLQGRVAQVFEWHKVEEPVTESGAKILSIKHISEKAPVKDLEATWVAENAKEVVKEVA